jgi:NifU-like protein involved in Fe-S cluster formation
MKQIKVKIDLSGQVEVEAVGFKGRGCKSATAPIEQALGMVAGTKDKPEIHVQDNNHLQQRQGNGW